MKWLTQTNIRMMLWIVALLVVVAAWSDRSATLRAQDNAAADNGKQVDEADEGEGNESLGSVIFRRPRDAKDWFGVVFYTVLAVFSVVAVAVILERIVNLKRGKVLPPAFVQSLQNLIRNTDGTGENFRRLSESTTAPVASILRAGVMRAGRPLPEVEKSMEDAAARAMSLLRGRNRPLSVIASVAPLVGLLGTVVGMIFAFHTSSQAGLGKAELLAQGIYLALLTTAAGLTIAIPCLLFGAWFNASVERFMFDIDECLLETMPSFAEMEQHKTRQTVEAEAVVEA